MVLAPLLQHIQKAVVFLPLFLRRTTMQGSASNSKAISTPLPFLTFDRIAGPTPPLETMEILANPQKSIKIYPEPALEPPGAQNPTREATVAQNPAQEVPGAQKPGREPPEVENPAQNASGA